MSLYEKLSSKKFFIFNLVLLGALFGFSLALFSFSLAKPATKQVAYAQSVPSPVSSDALSVAESLQKAFRAVSDAVLPVIVQVNTVEIQKQQVPQFNGIPWEFFFGTPQDSTPQGNQEREYRSKGVGSGIIVRKAGNTYYVLTNNHVAGSASEISITVNDGREFKAKLVGKDERKDLALISFESKENFPIAVLGDSDQVKVGDLAIAVGSPLGLMSSVTMGIVSAVGRTGGPAGNINDFIQTDAAINQGNSGGALVNIRGEVIGINTWIASPSGGSVGLGFSIPVNNVKRAIDDFITKGQVKYGWLGVSLIDADKDMAAELGIQNRRGALASQVFIGSPADKGGILPGDFIIKLNDKEVRNRDQLVLAVGDLKAGEQATFVVLRGGTERTIRVRIDERKDDVVSDNSKLWPGAIVTPVNEEIQKTLKLDAKVKGLYVVEVIAKSPAAVMGLQRGDIITGINGESARTLPDFYRLLNDKSKKDLWFEVQRGDTSLETMRYKRP
ncbi:Do family serine endopeptidase [Gracilinema caldarium]|uniref:Do family serine endopeptidase n=1 Tax=Gracilinema caldarium TaxID=215591 RepID=UPI0026F24665|nr:Do family serine endopeptidase [Gracilinema caldarium]